MPYPQMPQTPGQRPQQPQAFSDTMGADGETDDAQGATELCIEVAADGTLTVYSETTGPDGQEQESDRQPAADIGQALLAVLRLYKSLSQGGDGQAQLQAGYGSDTAPKAKPLGV